MKSSLIAAALLGLCSLTASGHEVWLERDTTGAVRVFFGEPGTELEQGEGLLQLKGAILTEAGQSTQLAVKVQSDHLLVPAGSKDVSFYADSVWQPWQTEDGLQAGILYARTGQQHQAPLLDFEFTPLKAGGDEFVLSFRGKPLAGHSLQLYKPGFWSKSFVTDNQGKIKLPATEAGQYLLVSSYTSKGPQQVATQQVQSVMHITSTSVIRH